jgi:hypothetical protein
MSFSVLLDVFIIFVAIKNYRQTQFTAFFVRQKTEEEIHRRLTIFSLKSTSTAVHDADVEVKLDRHLTKKTGFGDYTRQLCSVIFNISCLVLERSCC